MNEFTASNGITVERDGSMIFTTRGRLFADDAEALREFFQAERDEGLGRWRWPENPDYVVYGNAGAWDVRVVDERDGSGNWYQRGTRLDGPYADAARAYFDAHPERRVWGVRSPGEVWDIDVQTGGVRAVTVYSARHDEPIIVFRDAFTQVEYEENDPSIRDARRIWPEDAS